MPGTERDENSNVDWVTYGPGGVRGPLRLPLVKPPYSSITAIDLNTGDHLWQIPNGTTPDDIRNHPALEGVEIGNTGARAHATKLVTKTLLMYDLTAWEAEHGELADGTALLVRTGWSSRWNDRAAYLGTDLTGPEAVPELHFPGIAPEAAQWLVDNRGVAAVGIDTPSIDYGQSSDYRSHVILYERNIVGFENLTNLERLPATGAGIVALPMKIEGGSGGPLRVVGWVGGEDENMTNQRPFKIEIFVAEGLPDGLRLVTKSNWIGQGIVCPRGRYSHAKKRDEFSRSGVYLLVGQDGDQLPKLYVGEAEKVKNRLDLHYANKDFWQQAIVFTTKGTALNKAQVKYLEARLLESAKACGRAKLQNAVKSHPPTLSEADRAEMDGYLDELLSLLPVLGVPFFERDDKPSGDRRVYRVEGPGCKATGFETNTGFTVQKGSLAREPTVPSMKKKGFFPISGGRLVMREAIGVEVEASEVEVDGVRKAFLVAEAAAACLDRLDPAVDAFGGSVGRT